MFWTPSFFSPSSIQINAQHVLIINKCNSVVGYAVRTFHINLNGY